MLTREEKKTQCIAHIVCGVFAMMALLPFILLAIASFTDNTWATVNGFTFFPKKWSLEAYKYIAIQWNTIGKAYVMTIVVTVIGTVVSLVFSSTFAYAISQNQVPGMKLLNFMLILTMLFNGGIVASYYCYVRYFHIKDTIAALLVPNMMMNAFYVILLRNYFFSSIPASLMEAARIDGASEYKIFGGIVIPLSKPIMATVGLMTALGYWNDWMNGMYYLTERNGKDLYTIQIVLNKINENIQTLKQNAGELARMGATIPEMPSTTVRMAIAVVGILPIIIAYPFFQKYFVKGITLGAVKE